MQWRVYSLLYTIICMATKFTRAHINAQTISIQTILFSEFDEHSAHKKRIAIFTHTHT